MKKTAAIVMLAAAVALAGCASAGNQALRDADQTQIDQHVVRGKSTKQDVVAYLGAADSVQYTDSGMEIWSYTFARTSTKAINYVPIIGLFAGGANVDKKTLTILFDDKGVVKKSTYAASSGEVRTGILN